MIGASPVPAHSTKPAGHDAAAPALSVLSIGAGWFPDDPGGLERVYYALAKHLPQFGIRHSGLVTGPPSLPNDTQTRIFPFAARHANLLARWRAERRAFREVAGQEEIDLVASHFALYLYPLLGYVRGMPLVCHFHGPWAFESTQEKARGPAALAKLKLEQTVYRRADRCIVLSEAFKTELSTHYGVDPSRIHVIPGGVDVDAFATDATRAEAREALGWPPDRPTVVCVRRLIRRMGLENLIEAIDLVRKSVPEVLLYIAGKGPLEQPIRRLIRERQLDENVRLLGFVADERLPLVYRAADLSIVPTIALEGFGLITLESLACGTPVLVTPVGGLPEAIRNLSGDLILDGTSEQDIAAGLSEAIDGRRRLPSPDECTAYVREHHHWPVIAAKTAELYRSVVP